jgi:type IV secretory pathway TraG/TraD family ATPase VirD4
MTAQRLRMRCGIWKSRLTAYFGKHSNDEDADFAKLHELKRLLSDRVDVPSLNIGIGDYYHPLRVIATTPHEPLGNILLDATTRRGKGLAGQSQVLSWDDYSSLLFNDIKQWEYWDITAGHRNRHSRIRRFDPTSPFTHCYDPTLGKTEEHELYKIAEYLLFDPRETQPTFTRRAIKMFTQMLMGAVAEHQPRFPYIADMVNFDAQYTAEKLYRIRDVGPTLARKFLGRPFESMDWDSKFFHDCWDTLTAKLYIFTLPNVVHALSKSDFTAADIIRGRDPMTVYFCWPENEVDALNPLIRLVYSSLLDDMMTIYDNVRGKGCRRTLVLYDEAGRCPMPRLPHYTSTVVGRGISFWMGVQSLAQFEEHYGTYGLKTILDNIETFVRFRPATASMNNHQAISQSLGTRTKLVHSHTKNGEHEAEGTTERTAPLLSDHQIRKLQDVKSLHFTETYRRLEPSEWTGGIILSLWPAQKYRHHNC